MDWKTQDAKKVKPMKTPVAMKYLDNADLMKIFKVSDRTLSKWRKKRELLYFLIGGKIYYQADDIQEVVANKKRNSNREGENVIMR